VSTAATTANYSYGSGKMEAETTADPVRSKIL